MIVEIAQGCVGQSFELSRAWFSVTYSLSCMQVWFHYLYHFMLRRLSEKRPDYSCAWCNMYAGSLRGLVAHLVSSHDRFRFQATVRSRTFLVPVEGGAKSNGLLLYLQVGHDNIPHIYVMVVDKHPPATLSNGIARSALCELETSRDDGLDRFELHFSYLSAKKWGEKRAARLGSAPGTKAVDALMHEFDELDELLEEQPQEFYAPLLQRQYFHSRTGAVVLDHEKDYDSDDDVDEEWIIQQSEKVRCSAHFELTKSASGDDANIFRPCCCSCWTNLKTLRWRRRSS